MQKKIPCHFPWSSLYVSPNGDVKHCCSTNLNKLGNIAEQSIEEIWNGKLFRTVRSKIAAGDFDGAYCNPNCQGLRTDTGYPWPQVVKQGSEFILVNESKALKNFNNNLIVVNHFPTQLHLELSDHCNLRCIMCLYEFKPPYSFIPDNALEKLLEISVHASQISLMGGEVFINKKDLQFIDNYESQDGAWMGFITNASRLDDAMVERLTKFKNMGMQISLDGTQKEIYEKIRQNAKWEEVSANVKRIVNKACELNNIGFNWSVRLAYVVMASNLADVANAIKYAVSLGIFIGFHPVKGFNLFTENIYVYKNALKSTGDWQKHIQSAYDTLEAHKGQYAHYEAVKERLDDIRKILDNPKITVNKGVIRFLKFIVPGKTNKKAQGLTENDRKVGHLIEIYYNWKFGNASFKSTISYLFFKTGRVIKALFKGKQK